MSEMGIEKLYGMALRELESDAILELDPETYQGIAEFVGNLQRQEFDGIENEIRDLMVKTAARLAGILLRVRLEKGFVPEADTGNLLDEEKYVLDAEEEKTERMAAVGGAASGGKALLLARMAEKHKNRTVTVRFLKDVDRLMGSDYREYGPFREEYIGTIPYDNARSLVARGDAVRIGWVG